MPNFKFWVYHDVSHGYEIRIEEMWYIITTATYTRALARISLERVGESQT